jgi:serine/threonine protein kinase
MAIDPASHFPERITQRYEIIKKLGEGAYGYVWFLQCNVVRPKVEKQARKLQSKKSQRYSTERFLPKGHCGKSSY